MLDKLSSNERYDVVRGRDVFYGEVMALVMLKHKGKLEDVITEYNIEEVLEYKSMDVYELIFQDEEDQSEVYYDLDIRMFGLKYEDLKNKFRKIELVSFERSDGRLVWFQKQFIDRIKRDNNLSSNLWFGIVDYMDNNLLVIIDYNDFNELGRMYLLCQYVLDEDYNTIQGLKQIEDELSRIEIIDGKDYIKKLNIGVDKIVKDINFNREKRKLDAWITFVDKSKM